jgi:hypothetical protein
MLRERIKRHELVLQVELTIAEMPAFPIYREGPMRYSIYVRGERQVFPSESAARLGQITARALWLRAQGCPDDR